MTTTLTPPAAKTLPKPNGHFHQVTESLNDSERAILQKVRAFMETKVAPVINKYWADDAFPCELLPDFRDLKIAGLGYNGYECAGGGTLLAGFAAMEIARFRQTACRPGLKVRQRHVPYVECARNVAAVVHLGTGEGAGQCIVLIEIAKSTAAAPPLRRNR